jgi:hypothetical protein
MHIVQQLQEISVISVNSILSIMSLNSEVCFLIFGLDDSSNSDSGVLYWTVSVLIKSISVCYSLSFYCPQNQL